MSVRKLHSAFWLWLKLTLAAFLLLLAGILIRASGVKRSPR